MSLPAALDACLRALEPSVVALRRSLHAHPELSWQEHATQATLRAWLAEHGVQSRACAGTGLVVDVGHGGDRILYRGDIDALPIQERKPDGCAYTSQQRGVSHACGHDAHASVAAALAVAFQQLEPLLPGPIRVVLQPAEEVNPSGAARMVAEGALHGVVAALAVHMDPTQPAGGVGLRTGPLTSATDAVTITVRGQSGHSGRPFLCRDAIVAAADVVRAMHALVGQRVNPLAAAVLNFGRIHGGDAPNVIADEVVLDGVLRTLDADARATLQAEVPAVAAAAAAVWGCSAATTLVAGAPSVINDAWLGAIVEDAAIDVVGAARVRPLLVPSTGAEDFGFFGEVVPQYMMRVGCGADGAAVTHLHTPEFDVEESALLVAARIMGRAVLRAAAERPAI